MRGRFTTGMIVGSLLGASTAMLMDMDKRSMKKMKKRMNNMQNKFRV